MRTSSHPQVAAICIAVLLLSAVGCSAPPAKQVVLKGTARTAPSHFYPQSLRLAARGRVQARSGDAALAAEYFRAAYQTHRDIRYLLDYARSCERARFFNEASMAYTEALTHDIDEADRKRVTAEIERLATLVPKGEVPVTLQIRPHSARAIVAGTTAKKTGRAKSYERVVMGDAKIFLKPGKYRVHVQANGYRAELRSFRIKAGSATSSQGQLVGVTLQPDEKVPLAIAQHEHHGTPGKKPGKVGKKPADPDKKPVEAAADPSAEKPDPDTADDDEEDGGGEEGGAGEEDIPADAGVSSGGGGGGGALHKWGPIATAGVGILAIGGGAGLYFLANSEKDLAEAVNPSARNRAEIFDFHSKNAEFYWNMQYVAYGVGAALVVGGAIWMAAAPSSVAVAPHERGLAEVLRPTQLSFSGRTLGATWRF